jgi:transcriptional regulator with XRE-family HTH domain
MKAPMKSTGRSSRLRAVAITTQVCNDPYPGTRDEVILVSKATPTRRDELADFLRSRREALQPEDVGIARGERRRTPGLRREEVAQLAGVGATWYTWLEQGREVRASLSVLEAISEALRLTPAERMHLVQLGRGHEAPCSKAPPETISPTLRRIVEHLDTSLACVIGRRYDFLAWNRAYEAVFGDPAALPDGRVNFIWAMFVDPMRRELMPDWPQAQRRSAAKFRADSARHIGDPDFEELIEALNLASPEFRELWPRHEVATTGEGRKHLRHPVVGKLVFEHAVFKREEAPEQRLILYTPLPLADTPAKLAQLLGSDANRVAGPSPRKESAVG